METPGNLFVVAAPSGAGKSSLVNALLELDSHPALSVSHTTCEARGLAQHGREYWFVDEAEFRAMVARGEFFEWAQVHDHLYGTSRKAIEQRLEHGEDVVLEVDWQGAVQIKALFEHAVLIFILPPSWDELRQRLQRRGEDRPDVIDKRMANARHVLPTASLACGSADRCIAAVGIDVATLPSRHARLACPSKTRPSAVRGDRFLGPQSGLARQRRSPQDDRVDERHPT